MLESEKNFPAVHPIKQGMESPFQKKSLEFMKIPVARFLSRRYIFVIRLN